MDQYVARDTKNLVATQKGISLISQIDSIGIEILHAPDLTGEWEYKLKQMEQGKLQRPRFMQEIRELTNDIVQRARGYIQEVKSRDYPELDATCPNCGDSPLKGNERGWTCRSCTFKLFRGISGRELSDPEAKTLLSTRFLGPLTGFRNRFGKDFDAALELDENHKVTFAFETKEEQARRLDALKAGQALIPCPKCSKKGEDVMIRMTDTDYVCENHARDRKICPARLPRELCKYAIPQEQASKLFLQGETDVIEQFISKKGRPFKASLVADWDGKKFLNWKFPPRESAKKAASEDGETPVKKAPAKKAARKSAAKSVRKTAAKKVAS